MNGKLDIARQELNDHLSTISNQLREQHQIAFASPSEIEILHAAPPSHVHASFTTTGDDRNSFQEGEGYRCKCIFQIVTRSFLSDKQSNESGDCDGNNGSADQTTTTTTPDTDNDFVYVTREDGKLLPLPNNDIFPPANIRIRRAMTDLMGCLNRKITCNDMNECKETPSSYAFGRIRDNLTSATFVTSWGDLVQHKSLTPGSTTQRLGGDCLVTLHYGPPGLPKNEDALQDWKNEAKTLCEQCQFTLLTGRSKGIKISVSASRNDESNHTDIDEAIREEGIIHDDLWLTLREIPGSSGSAKKLVEVERVTLAPPTTILQSQEENESNSATTDDQKHNVLIQYQKPATAFQHPNAGVMLTSLHWILNILSNIVKQSDIDSGKASTQATAAEVVTTKTNTAKLRLLEMYCGCGAHTLPLAKSTLLSEIVAVELDERLVNACRNNFRLNNCLKDQDDSEQADDRTLVQVFKGDAAEWAAKTLRKQQHKHNDAKTGQPIDDDSNNFDILLVDPPRDGLSPTVCDMALKGTFTHVIYVSCGRRALLRDLTILCCGGDGEGGFDVMDLAVIDLFPGTDAVESLVHLKRR